MLPRQFSINLPKWAHDIGLEETFESDHDKMAFVIELSHLNVKNGTGGPFGAAVFADNKLISIGVNRVVPNHCSMAHAEMTALSLAQEHYKTFDLGGVNESGEAMPHHSLFVSAQPCVMCFGGVIWSGVRRLVFAATGHDVENLTGFDEGPLVSDWQDQLKLRGIDVVSGFMREEALTILKMYKDSGAPIYNGRRG